MSDQTRDVLLAVGRRLDDARDLLDAAAEQATVLERSLRGHEYAINDLHWDAAKVLLDPEPTRPAMRAVQVGAEQLLEQLRDSTTIADQLRDTLSAAGQQLRHTDRLIGALGAASLDPVHAVEVATLFGSGTVTAAHTRDLLRRHQQQHSAAPSTRGPSGPAL